MSAMPGTASLKAELAAILVRVRRRWRLRRALLGAVWFLAAGAGYLHSLCGLRIGDDKHFSMRMLRGCDRVGEEIAPG